jgi:hypothetical protein
MLKTLDKVADQIEIEVEEGLFSGPDDPLQILAEIWRKKSLPSPACH